MRKLSTLSFLLSVFLVEGCAPWSAGQPETGAEPSVQVYKGREIYLPFDEYLLSPSEYSDVFAAKERLTASCMRSSDVKWHEIQSAIDEASSGNMRRYGVIDESVAASYGYHIPPADPAVLRRLKEENDREKNLNSEVYLKAFGKDGRGGCARWAYEKLLDGTPKASFDLFNDLNRKSFSTAMGDPEVEKLLAKWRKCVKRENYNYASPLEMSGDSRWFSGKVISSSEKKAAVTDVRCSEAIGLAAVLMSQEAKIQRGLIGANVEYFDDLKEIREVNVSSARKVLRAE